MGFKEAIKSLLLGPSSETIVMGTSPEYLTQMVKDYGNTPAVTGVSARTWQNHSRGSNFSTEDIGRKIIVQGKNGLSFRTDEYQRTTKTTRFTTPEGKKVTRIETKTIDPLNGKEYYWVEEKISDGKGETSCSTSVPRLLF